MKEQTIEDLTMLSLEIGFVSVAMINQNHIVTKIWAGDTNEYALYQEVEHIDKCVYIDNFEGPIRATWGWKNLSRSDIEETFSFRFDDNDLAELGGFPNNLIIVS